MVHAGGTRLFGIASILLILSSCIKDNVDLNKVSMKLDWNPVYGIPVAYGDITVKDFVNVLDSLGIIKIYPADSMLYLTYSQNVISKNASEIMQIPDQNFQEVFKNSDAGFPPLPGNLSDSIYFIRNTDYNFSFNNNEEIDSIHLKSGTILFNIQSSFQHAGWIRITLTSMKKNGRPLQIKIPITKSDGSFFSTVSVAIDDYALSFTTVNGTSNHMPYMYEVVLYNQNGQPLLANQEITTGIHINQTKFKSLFGYVGQYTVLDTLSNFKLNIFNTKDKNISLEFLNPKLHLYFENSFGLPISSSLQNTYAISNNVNYPITFTPTVNPFILKAPALKNFTASKETLTIDNKSSNLDPVIAKAPQYVYFGIKANTNPIGKTSNFVLDTSKFNVECEVELPMYLKAKNYERNDTMKFDVSSSIPDISIVKQALIHTNFTNTIPISLSVQITMTDQQYKPLFVLYDDNQQPLIASGLVDNNGKVNSPGTKITDVKLTADQITQMPNVKFAIVKATITTSGNGANPVKFFSYSKLKVSMGIITELQIKNLNQL